MAMGAGVPTTFWSVTGSGPAHGSAYILTWAMQIANTTTPPLVTSISYGDTEQGFFDHFGNYDYVNRMNDELAKMALRGLTVIAGSGDAGASNVGEEGNDISPTDPTCVPFRPFFPSNSPYVLSVSSTFLTPNALPICNQQLSNQQPIQCQQVGEVGVSVTDGLFWTTGGGFSNMSSNPAPDWQRAEVTSYLTSMSNRGKLPPNEYWNQNGRGYPDVSTVGHNLLMVFGGHITSVDGTSASGPVMAGLISLLNDARLNADKPPLGFVNEFFYDAHRTHPAAFQDVVLGTNADGDIQPRCSPYPMTCPYGFFAAPGWDPVSGLGTPNFSVLLDLALAL